MRRRTHVLRGKNVQVRSSTARRTRPRCARPALALSAHHPASDQDPRAVPPRHRIHPRLELPDRARLRRAPRLPRAREQGARPRGRPRAAARREQRSAGRRLAPHQRDRVRGLDRQREYQVSAVRVENKSRVGSQVLTSCFSFSPAQFPIRLLTAARVSIEGGACTLTAIDGMYFSLVQRHDSTTSSEQGPKGSVRGWGYVAIWMGRYAKFAPRDARCTEM
jgi:hypothetical protein